MQHAVLMLAPLFLFSPPGRWLLGSLIILAGLIVLCRPQNDLEWAVILILFLWITCRRPAVWLWWQIRDRFY
jgi:hypothetical protein